MLENEKAKIYWNVSFIHEKPPENGANKPDVIAHDKETNILTLVEGTVCQVNKFAERFKEKQKKKNTWNCGQALKEIKNVQVYIKSILSLTFLEGTMSN